MIEIILHGRAGQPLAVLAQAIARAALLEGKYAQCYTSFAAVRDGAPNFAVARIEDNPIRERVAMASTNPTCAALLDDTLLGIVNPSVGLPADGHLVVTPKAKGALTALPATLNVCEVPVDGANPRQAQARLAAAAAQACGAASVTSVAAALEELKQPELAEAVRNA